MATEMWGADDWLYGILTGDEALSAMLPGGWSPDLAAEGTPYPLGVFSLQSAVDANSLGLERATARMVYLVKVVCEGDDNSALRPALDRVDALIHGQRAQLSGQALTVARTGVRRYFEYVNNVRYTHAGGVYSFVSQPFGD